MTSPWQQRRQKSGWSRGYAEWTENGLTKISVVFSWLLDFAKDRAAQLHREGHQVVMSGPAVLMDSIHAGPHAYVGPHADPVLPRHNPNATRTTLGCPWKCSFCLVKDIEPEFTELKTWDPQPIICDNNFVASSHPHFNRVIDTLKSWQARNPGKHNLVDFNQGLDIRHLSPERAARLAELDLVCARLAWDHIEDEVLFMEAFDTLRRAGFWRRRIRAYVLIGYKDTPEDALHRLAMVHRLGAKPFPMRYQPAGIAEKNAYVAPGWTDKELTRYVRYWSNLIKLAPIPFHEFELEKCKKTTDPVIRSSAVSDSGRTVSAQSSTYAAGGS